jgi:hypothetical protein
MTPDSPGKIAILAATASFTTFQQQLFDELKNQS